MRTEKGLLDKLDELRKTPSETEWLEFKEAKNSFDFDNLGKYFSALSNEANLKQKSSGWLILGVKDKPPHDIVGTSFKPSLKETNGLKHDISLHTNGITLQEIYELHLPEGRVLMFQIPAAPAGMPTSWKGHYYGREGESLVPLSTNKRETVRAQSGQFDWSAEICPGADLSHLDERALSVARAKFHKKYETRLNKDIEKWDDATFLEKAKLTKSGRITRTTILLLGKPESSHFLNPHLAQITWKLDAEEKGYQHFGPPFLLSVEDVFRHIRNINFRIQPRNQLIPIELTKYDPKVVLEGLNNCIAHQDYTQNARIIIEEYADKLVLQNIGEFYEGSIEDYLLQKRTPDRYRNPFLVQAMVNLNMIDTMGEGIRRMFQEQRKRFFPLPDFDFSDYNHVRLTIYGKLIDENYSRLLMEREDLSLPEVLALDQIQKKKIIPKELVKELREKRLVEGRYPNVFVSAKIAQVTDKKAEYTKHKAFDKQYYKDLIINFLKQHKEASPKDFHLLIIAKLSDALTQTQKQNKVRNILQEMVREGLIENHGGRGKQAKWMLKKR